jgi:hypothetical protein
VFIEATEAPIAWDGKDTRRIAAAWTESNKPKAVFTAAKVTNGVFDSGVLATGALFSFAIQNQSIEVPIRELRIRMKLTQTGATEGMIAGLFLTSELEAAIAKAATYMSPTFCSGSTIDGIRQAIRQASDILADGTQDPTKECNAISIGVAFEALPVLATEIAPVPMPLTDPCK